MVFHSRYKGTALKTQAQSKGPMCVGDEAIGGHISAHSPPAVDGISTAGEATLTTLSTKTQRDGCCCTSGSCYKWYYNPSFPSIGRESADADSHPVEEKEVHRYPAMHLHAGYGRNRPPRSPPVVTAMAEPGTLGRADRAYKCVI